jgi:hypothetical protein
VFWGELLSKFLCSPSHIHNPIYLSAKLEARIFWGECPARILLSPSFQLFAKPNPLQQFFFYFFLFSWQERPGYVMDEAKANLSS